MIVKNRKESWNHGMGDLTILSYNFFLNALFNLKHWPVKPGLSSQAFLESPCGFNLRCEIFTIKLSE